METVTIVSPLAQILYNVTLMRTTGFSASQIQRGNKDILHFMFLWAYIIDAHAMWYFFNQNYIIFKFIFFWKSLMKTRDF